MARTYSLLLFGIVILALLLGAIWFHSWGGLALVVVGAIGIIWYRMQVARTDDAEDFFGDAGEETRMTGFQGGSPSEMPVDRGPAPRAPDRPAS
jgi:hypothetical protein